MSKRYGGLGKGLGALIPNMENLDNKDNGIKKINLDLISPNENQPRKRFEEEKIVELSNSIKEHGIIQPLILQLDGNRYRIIAGERRWRAAKYLNLKEVPCIILNLAEKDVLQISLIENIQREDLNPIEEADAYKRLIDEFKMTHEELSNKLGKSRVVITNSLRLLKLDDRVKRCLLDGKISEGHGRALLGIDNNDLQYEFCNLIIQNNLSVRETEKLIKKAKNEKAKEVIKKDDPFLRDITSRLEMYFNTRVSVSNSKNKGKIEIEYYSKDDLNRIIELLNVNDY